MGLRTVLRHALVRLGLEGVVVWYWRATGRDTAFIEGSRRERFDRIYKTGQWTHGDLGHESLSGYGSTIEATKNVREGLPALLKELRATRLLDVGCGDFNWMKWVDLPCPYIGVDIVESVVKANRAQYENDQRAFRCLDAVEDALPSVDVVLCREVLFHLSMADATKLLANIRQSGARYLLATTDPEVAVNRDIPSGEWREINLELPPYRLGRRMAQLQDGDGPRQSRMLAVWALT